jgi:hypothetical protein
MFLQQFGSDLISRLLLGGRVDTETIVGLTSNIEYLKIYKVQIAP